MRREHTVLSSPSGSWTEITRVTSVGTSSITIPAGYTNIGLWVVGGGGSGASEHGNSDNCGLGGNGGQARDFIISNNGGAITASVTVGSGGPQTATGTNKTGSDGGNTSVTINGTTYTANGGLMGPGGNTSGSPTKVEYSGRCGVGWGIPWGSAPYGPYWVNPNPSVIGRYPDGAPFNGENGLPNPFDDNDTNLYGAGGGGGFDSYRNSGHPNDSFSYGGDTGGGPGGGGDNNASSNAGGNATFYGGGGGGGAFSSNHTYGRGGAGYQGIVIIYGQ